MAKLIQNPNSTNKLYVPQSQFPINDLYGNGVIYLNDDGTYDIRTNGSSRVEFRISATSGAAIINTLGVTNLVNLTDVLAYFRDSSGSVVKQFQKVGSSPVTQRDGMDLFNVGARNVASIEVRLYFTSPQQKFTLKLMAAFLSAQSISGFQSAYMVAPNTYTVTYRDPSGTHQDVTYSAVWTANTYQIKWVDPSGTNATVTNSATYGSATPTPPTWTRPGYELAGWTPELAEIVTADVTYTAVWITEGTGDSPVTLSQARAWADANGYQSGTTLAGADKMLLTYDLLAAMSGVVRLEYIEGTGTQFIDTGFNPTGDTRVTTTIVPASESPTETFGVFGGRSTNAVKTFCLWQIKGKFRTDYGATASNKDVNVTASGTITIDKNMGTTTINGVVSTAYHSSFTSTNTLVLFGINGGSGSTFPGSDTVDSRLFKGRMFETCVYDNGTLVRNLIPAKRNSDGAIGMYDTVHNQFYGNSGTGSFVAGPEVQNGDPMAADGSEYVTLEQFREWANSGGGGLSS